ncbi:3-methyl-2-oxobutanoate hydroxymethyltransferase [Peptostreptococcaceae bacterium AGR-M142]
MKKTVETFKRLKNEGKKIKMLTAYDYSMARIIDECDIDGILVGDSLGMVVLGHENTLSVTLDEMLHHLKAVTRGAKNSLVVCDMPFMSYGVNEEDTLKNAGKLMKQGYCNAVKLEGGKEILSHIKKLINNKIPVMGHLGLTPQSINEMGGYKVQGKDEDSIKKLMEDALLLEEAGVFSIVLECVPKQVAKMISDKLKIPVIGIGSGSHCDGQILVYKDMLNILFDFKPKFVKVFSDVKSQIIKGIDLYKEEVDNLSFPKDEHSFTLKEEVLNKIY